MLTCKQCKDDACPGAGSDASGCDDFTGAVIEEEPVEWKPTPEDYNRVAEEYEAVCSLNTELSTRIKGYERAVADLVKFAQEETP